ncbi:FAD-binding oxidoreductase [Phenylobacterium sp.]|uniref:NAD(P)/FAD-dependent oxidoreductase n=1 Tax=Phenylobacterium sp. TaxID=1871053 RepID=UPI00301B843E
MNSRGSHVPHSPLAGPLDVDVVIVGAGVSGAFMAHELARDHSVAVLDRRGPVQGSTLASTAMLQWEIDLPLIALADKIGAAEAARVYRRSYAAVGDLLRIVDEARIRCAIQRKTSIYLAGDAYGSRALRREVAARTAIGLPSAYLTGRDLRMRFGMARTGAILSEGSASADPACLAAGLLRRAIRAGAKVYAPVEVTEVLRGHGRLGLVTDSGFEVRATHLVFCCGYEFPKGVPTPGAEVVSTWALATSPEVEAPSWLADHLVWEASEPYLYFRATKDGRLVVGGEDEASASRHGDPRLLRPKAQAILRKLKRLTPELEVSADHVWAGAFGASATGLPLIAPTPGLPGAYAVMGFGGNGITYSVIASQIVSAAIRGTPDPDAALFAPRP